MWLFTWSLFSFSLWENFPCFSSVYSNLFLYNLKIYPIASPVHCKGFSKNNQYKVHKSTFVVCKIDQLFPSKTHCYIRVQKYFTLHSSPPTLQVDIVDRDKTVSEEDGWSIIQRRHSDFDSAFLLIHNWLSLIPLPPPPQWWVDIGVILD